MSSQQNKHLTLLLIFCIGLILRLYMIQIDPYLHEWDERYHALVARNLMDDLLHPVLRKYCMIPYDFKEWTNNHIWLHKQPLFLWQMALSMKLFGVSVFSMRLPSAFMGALMVPMLYQISFLYTKSQFTAYLAAILLCFSQFQLELIAGEHGMEHNDIAFSFYILASFWAYFEYLNHPKRKWLVLIGLFAGCAIMNKWLVGLLIFSGMGLNTIIDYSKNKDSIKDFIIALFVCLLIMSPWQIFTFLNYPVEASYEMDYNKLHIFIPVEGHEGSLWFYFENFKHYFGNYLEYLLPIGIIIVVKHSKNDLNAMGRSLLLSFLLVFIFFSFIVQTKLWSYFFIVAPIGMIYISMSIQNFVKWIPTKFAKLKWLVVIPLVYLSLSGFDIISNRKNNQFYRNNRIQNTLVYKNFNREIYSKNDIFINLPDKEYIDFMFFNNELTAYGNKEKQMNYDSLEKAKVNLISFSTSNSNDSLASHLNYPYFKKLNIELKSN